METINIFFCPPALLPKRAVLKNRQAMRKSSRARDKLFSLCKLTTGFSLEGDTHTECFLFSDPWFGILDGLFCVFTTKFQRPQRYFSKNKTLTVKNESWREKSIQSILLAQINPLINLFSVWPVPLWNQIARVYRAFVPECLQHELRRWQYSNWDGKSRNCYYPFRNDSPQPGCKSLLCEGR